MRRGKKGFVVSELFVFVVVFVVVTGVGYVVIHKNKPAPKPTTIAPAASAGKLITWKFNGTSWQTNAPLPACASPLTIAAPTDVSKSVSILYPGQYRGGDYKSHGGFRFADGTNSKVTVKIPMDSTLLEGSRYIEQSETQYLLFFVAPCGIIYRFDHLATLSSGLQQIVDANFPAAKENNSATTTLNKTYKFKTGDTVATAVGFKKTGNTSFDFGVYDVRTGNPLSKNNPQWVALHQADKEFSFFGVCWFDLLPTADATKVKALPPGDSLSGAISDYCATPAGNTLTNTVGNPKH